VPFEINPAGVPAGDANTDVLLIAYGSSENFVSCVPADQPSNSSSNFKVSVNRDGFRAGDLVVGVQPGGGPGGGPSCVMHELTGVPGTGGNCGAPATGGSDVLNHNTGQYKNPNVDCEMTSATHNNASGIKDANGQTVPALKAAQGGQLFNLGALPQVKVYAIRGGNLTTCDMLNTDCTVMTNWAIVVSNIVSMRALYGQDLAPVSPRDNAVDQWNRSALDTSDKVQRVLAAAVEITARNPLKEKPSSGTACDATTNAAFPDRGQTKVWYDQYTAMATAGGLTGGAIDLSTTAGDWACYRYKLFQTTVPLRNLIWRP